jgi:hypothetical protein
LKPCLACAPRAPALLLPHNASSLHKPPPSKGPRPPAQRHDRPQRGDLQRRAAAGAGGHPLQPRHRVRGRPGRGRGRREARAWWFPRHVACTRAPRRTPSSPAASSLPPPSPTRPPPPATAPSRRCWRWRAPTAGRRTSQATCRCPSGAAASDLPLPAPAAWLRLGPPVCMHAPGSLALMPSERPRPRSLLCSDANAIIAAVEATLPRGAALAVFDAVTSNSALALPLARLIAICKERWVAPAWRSRPAPRAGYQTCRARGRAPRGPPLPRPADARPAPRPSRPAKFPRGGRRHRRAG